MRLANSRVETKDLFRLGILGEKGRGEISEIPPLYIGEEKYINRFPRVFLLKYTRPITVQFHE